MKPVGFFSSFSVYSFIYFLRKRHICARMGLSFGGTTFMILSLVLRRRPLSRSLCGKKRGPVYKVAFFPLFFCFFSPFERSKLHQVDGEVRFTCHSVELPPNEMLHTDFCLRARGDKTVVTE